jgi:tetratricopeptide (TPR) repeat protein
VALASFEIDAAESHAERLFQAAPNRPEALSLYAMAKLRKGNIAAEAGRHAEAEALYAQGLSANPRFGELHGALGMLYGKQKRWPEAAGELKYFIDLSPSEPLGYILLGSAYASVGQPDDAKESWTRGLAVARKTQNETRIAQLEHLLEQTESAR